eukprot:SAG22_NODE_6287_length_874_cov_2.046452_1_plen_163_part_10
MASHPSGGAVPPLPPPPPAFGRRPQHALLSSVFWAALFPIATRGVTQCADYHTCSECSQHSFGCSKPDTWTGAWPWGSPAIDPSVGKMSNATECYFSCGWCPNTLNHETGLPGVCVQVSHTEHGGNCDGSLNCAECICEGCAARQSVIPSSRNLGLVLTTQHC